ncbi:MAG: peptidylprolyl isomerase [Caulobacter sp.]|nr:peptidylprolyl isomerase [Caulobacter sp.]
MKKHRRQVLGLLAAAPFAGSAAMARTTAPAETPAPVRPRVRLETPQGPIVIELYTDKAPITAANFLRYVDEKRYVGAHFYRSIRFSGAGMENYGLLQGGLNGSGRPLPPIVHEPTTQTGLSHKDGAVSLARETPGSGKSEFFICLGDMSNGLDADPKSPGDNLGYAVFGQIVEGKEVALALQKAPLSATKGAEFGMKGQMLDPVIPIPAMTRVS